MKISLIHPSRGRPEKAKATYDYWMSKISGKHEIEHILSLDFSDPLNEMYGVVKIDVNGIAEDKYIGFGANSKTIIDRNISVVDATNEAAKLSTGNILIYMSDDFKCPDNWDELIAFSFNYGQVETPMLLKVDDCLQKFDIRVLTIPIMNRALYKTLGYFWHHEYRSMFVDQHLYEICAKNYWLAFAPALKFPHEHPCNGKAEDDETYQRSAANWNQGKELFAKHQLEGFPL